MLTDWYFIALYCACIAWYTCIAIIAVYWRTGVSRSEYRSYFAIGYCIALELSLILVIGNCIALELSLILAIGNWIEFELTFTFAIW